MDSKKDKTIKYNSWMENPDFIENMHFKDKYYLRNLLNVLSSFIKKCPLPIVTYWHYKTPSISIQFRDKENFFKISTNIAIQDWIQLVDRSLREYYPQYNIVTSEDRPLNNEEIELGIRKGKFGLDEAFNMFSSHKVKEDGIIDQIYLPSDEFRFTKNSLSEIRMSGNVQTMKSLSLFLREIRSIHDHEHVRAYINENSRLVKHISDRTENILIDYKGDKLINFFIINKNYILSTKVIYEDSLIHIYGKFTIVFESDSHYNDCMSILKRNNAKLVY